MAKAKDLLGSLVLKQEGKVVEEPGAGNVAVYVKAGSPIGAVSGVEIVRVLKAEYPRAIFTFCAKAPPEEPKAGSKKAEK